MRKGNAVALNGPRHGEFFMADHFTFLDGRAETGVWENLASFRQRSLGARSYLLQYLWQAIFGRP